MHICWLFRINVCVCVFVCLRICMIGRVRLDGSMQGIPSNRQKSPAGTDAAAQYPDPHPARHYKSQDRFKVESHYAGKRDYNYLFCAL